jgi:pimeloyl-ACP methyl ester carboxylesterase/class 3 adenylate cyclase
MPVQPETRYAKSGDAWIAYRIFGEGPFDVVLHPGLISHVELMTELQTYHGRIVERLASFSRVIVLDQRGVGMSDRVSGSPSLETRMDDVRAVMDAASLSRAAILSVGLGVPMSVLFAATYPERTCALALVRSFPRLMWAPDYPSGWTLERHRSITDAFQTLFFRPRHEAAEALGVVSSQYSDGDLEYLRRAAANPGTVETLAAMDLEVDVRHVLPAVRVPTLLVHASQDPAWPIEGARYMAERIPGAKLVEVPGEGLLSGAGFERALDETEAFLKEAWEAGAWEEPEPDRVLATVLFTDIVGSSERAVELGDRAWRELLERNHELVRRQLRELRRPARAIRCAEAIVEGVHALGLEVRAGLHTGECELLDGKVAGIAVHTGSRVASEAAPGEVLVSSTVKDLVAGSGLAFEERGTHELKGVPGQWHLYAVER